MAAITAYGEREVARWQATSIGGVTRTFVLTERKGGKPGRLLAKGGSWGRGYKVVKRAVPLPQAERFALSYHGAERVL